MFQPLGEGELRAAYLEKGQQAGATKPESSEAIQQPSKSGWGSVVTEDGTEGEEEGEDREPSMVQAARSGEDVRNLRNL